MPAGGRRVADCFEGADGFEAPCREFAIPKLTAGKVEKPAKAQAKRNGSLAMLIYTSQTRSVSPSRQDGRKRRRQIWMTKLKAALLEANRNRALTRKQQRVRHFAQ